MTMKELFRKQVIILINNNKTNFIKDNSNYVTNLNRILKNIKSDIMVDFIHQEISEITIVINKVTSTLDLQIIENYIKNANCIEAKGVEVSCLSQSKLYLKIIDILYLEKFTNTCITSKVVQEIIKKNHIFNNIALVSKLHIIKVFSKLDMSII